jgi:hypothetical protein
MAPLCQTGLHTLYAVHRRFLVLDKLRSAFDARAAFPLFHHWQLPRSSSSYASALAMYPSCVFVWNICDASYFLPLHELPPK